MESSVQSLVPAVTLVSEADDRVVNGYLNGLAKVNKSTPGALKIHAFPSFFFPAIKAGGFTRVERWTKGVKVGEKDLIFFPLNVPGHWVLIAADLRKKEIRSFNSLGREYPEQLHQVLSYLEWETTRRSAKFERGQWTLKGNPRGLPRQKNGIDCGFCLGFYAKTLAAGEDPVSAPMPASKELRKMIAAALRDWTLNPRAPGWGDVFVGTEPQWSGEDLDDALCAYMREIVSLSSDQADEVSQVETPLVPESRGSQPEADGERSGNSSPEWEVLHIERPGEETTSAPVTPSKEDDVLSIDADMDILDDRLEEDMEVDRCTETRATNSDVRVVEEPETIMAVAEAGPPVPLDQPSLRGRPRPVMKRRRVRLTLPDGTTRRINVRKLGLKVFKPFD